MKLSTETQIIILIEYAFAILVMIGLSIESGDKIIIFVTIFAIFSYLMLLLDTIKRWK